MFVKCAKHNLLTLKTYTAMLILLLTMTKLMTSCL